ncbi:hypothetical protein D3C73_1487430 [compost metagenome]
MPKDIVTLGDIFGFLMVFLDPWHSAALLGLFHAIANQDHTILNNEQRRMVAHDLKPLLP